MSLQTLVSQCRALHASDLHLEPGLVPCVRTRGQLRNLGSEPVPARTLLGYAREVIGEERWNDFLERRSFDLSLALGGVRCRINVLCSSRGVGMAIRFLASFRASLASLNLHPDLLRLVQPRNGLVLVSGSTGSGKSTTLAALIQELNERERRHIVTLESPIEYAFQPQQAFIRQREIGRDTPSFEQGLYDAMREDPDVLMVGELRDQETMRLTLNAAETGHLVLATVHSSSAAEALQRIANAFPAEMTAGICAQLADCLVGVVCQRMRWLDARKAAAPECEVLFATQTVKAILRQGQFFKLQTALETGGSDGLFTFARYREWLDRRADWSAPQPAELAPAVEAPLPELRPRTKAPRPAAQEGVLEIAADDDLAGILQELEKD